MKTVFLVAGQSSRVMPLSDKNLLEFGGEPLLIKLLKNAERGGLRNFVVVANKYNKNFVKSVLQKHNFSADIALQEDPEGGMFNAIQASFSFVSDDEPLFILGGNDCVDGNIYQSMVEQAKGCDGSFLAKQMDYYFPGGYFEIDDGNIIQSMVEKPGEGNEPSSLVRIVADYFQRASDVKEVFQSLVSLPSQEIHHDKYANALEKLIVLKKIKAVSYKGYWQAIKYPWHVLDMMQGFLGRQELFISPKSEIDSSVVFRGESIVISKGVKILENTVIEGPCFIGRDVFIGRESFVGQSNIGRSCILGDRVKVERSFLGSDSRVNTNGFVLDSIIDREVSFGESSRTNNIRSDKKNIQVEVKKNLIDSYRPKLGAIIGKGAQIKKNTILIPGVKICENQLI